MGLFDDDTPQQQQKWVAEFLRLAGTNRTWRRILAAEGLWRERWLHEAQAGLSDERGPDLVALSALYRPIVPMALGLLYQFAFADVVAARIGPVLGAARRAQKSRKSPSLQPFHRTQEVRRHCHRFGRLQRLQMLLREHGLPCGARSVAGLGELAVRATGRRFGDDAEVLRNNLLRHAKTTLRQK